jgi:hypothetical protein
VEGYQDLPDLLSIICILRTALSASREQKSLYLLDYGGDIAEQTAV